MNGGASTRDGPTRRISAKSASNGHAIAPEMSRTIIRIKHFNERPETRFIAKCKATVKARLAECNGQQPMASLSTIVESTQPAEPVPSREP